MVCLWMILPNEARLLLSLKCEEDIRPILNCTKIDLHANKPKWQIANGVQTVR